KILDSKGKKQVAKPMTLPEQTKKTVNVSANFLCDNSSYIFGFDNKGKPERSKKCFEAFKVLHNEILENVECDEAKAVLSFLDKWDVEKATEHIAIVDYLTDIYTGANFIFMLNGKNNYVHNHAEIKNAWQTYKSKSSNDKKQQCLVTGEENSIARLHPIIKGIRGGQAMGNSLVSFNASAYESYGNNKSQGLNSPVSEYACFAYGTALNSLLSDNSHKISLGDATIVFWAETADKYCQDFFSMMIEPAEANEQRYVRDEYAVKNIKSVFEKIANGQKVATNQVIDEDVQFYVLGLSPNAARLSVRFFIEDSFEVFVNKIVKHYQDMAIQKQFDNELNSISIWKMLNETVSPKSSDKSASPLLAGSVLRSILTGSPYPTALFNSVMIRIRAERDINYYKASIIKAYLTRCANSKKYEEVLTVALNETSDNKAYVLGRLFAALEKAQQDASTSKLNTTIKDKYFTSACGTPANVFPVLLKLSSHHISKAEYGYASDKRISVIMDILNVDNSPFPKNLSLEEQGVFILGYYHQKNNLYKKAEDK
ncbi:MAG TPA: type I-C CRISPR-associated protein Cas8c/Csd1, partial [Clostridiales bacterium]|nr:type I-C CRISPR-associated protein Cas8c/Csd1 [Clostridiales bacterium]